MGPCPGDPSSHWPPLVYMKAAMEAPGRAFQGSYCFHDSVGEPERVSISTELPRGYRDNEDI